MAQDNQAGSSHKAVQIRPALSTSIRHPIKSARLLYSLPPIMMSATIYLIFIIIFSALVYSFWATKSLMVTAPLVLEKDSFVVQVTGDGLVSEISVLENSIIRSGDALAVIQEQLRPFDNAQRDALEGQKIELEKERDKMTNEFENNITQLNFELEDLKTGRSGRIKELEGQINLLGQQLKTSKNALRTTQKSLSIAKSQYQRIEQLFISRDVTIVQRDQALEKLNAAQKNSFDAESRVAEIKITLQSSRAELGKFKDLLRQEKIETQISQTKVRRDRELKRISEQINGLENRLTQAKFQEGATYVDNKAKYSSFFDGVITAIHVKRGEMIRAGSPLVTIVRDTAVLEAHAFVDNKDIGRLKRGQQVQIKYFAYPYQEYGIATGLTSFIATTPSGLPGKESKYLIKIALQKDKINKKGGTPKKLEIGLEGMVEIKTGQKRFIEILFSPISRFFDAEE